MAMGSAVCSGWWVPLERLWLWGKPVGEGLKSMEALREKGRVGEERCVCLRKRSTKRPVECLVL